MCNILLNKRIKLSFCVQFYLAIPVNILLWGSDSWALSTDLCRKLKTCHNKFTRHLCGITRWHCHEYHISMNDIFERLNITSIDKIIDLRTIRFLQESGNATIDTFNPKNHELPSSPSRRIQITEEQTQHPQNIQTKPIIALWKKIWAYPKDRYQEKKCNHVLLNRLIASCRNHTAENNT